MSYRQAKAALQKLANPAKARILAGFFKTGKGDYGEGDRFLGINVPALRKVAEQFHDLTLTACAQLLRSPYNDDRLLALLILGERYRRGGTAEQLAIYRLYMRHRARVNNWNLVDGSAPNILGAHLLNRDRAVLKKLAVSDSLWDRRIAIVATHTFIRNHQYADTLQLAEQLLGDSEDLLHKACGWMLREVGKRDEAILKKFLTKHHRRMPRTMLRYAIERFAEPQRRALMRKPEVRVA